MNARVAILSAFAVGVTAGLVVGCQTYDFEPVEPLALAQVTEAHDVVARNLKPNVMLLVDRSLSMDDPVNRTDAKCKFPDGGICGQSKDSLCNTNPALPSYCPTRWSELQGAMSDFLTDAGTVARLGMSIFPVIYNPRSLDGQCGVPTDATQPLGAQLRVDVSQSDDVDSELQQQATAIKGNLLSITSTQPLDGGVDNTTYGGTPTGASLAELAKNPRLNDPVREDFVLVLTDGLPNCNSSNVNNYNSTSCRCTIAQTCPQFSKNLGCLDQEGTVAQVNALRAKQIRTIVVGFGADTATGDGPNVLNAMAAAGGLARECPDGGDGACGTGDTCNPSTRLCNTAFYKAANRSELISALSDIGQRIGTGDPCLFVLSAKPSDPRLLSVLIAGVPQQSGADTWIYDDPTTTVKLTGALCDKAQKATSKDPLKVEIRILQGL